MLETDFDVMIVATEDCTCSYYSQIKSNFVACATYIPVGVLDGLALFSEVNSVFHFLIYCTLRNILHWAVICVTVRQ